MGVGIFSGEGIFLRLQYMYVYSTQSQAMPRNYMYSSTVSCQTICSNYDIAILACMLTTRTAFFLASFELIAVGEK